MVTTLLEEITGLVDPQLTLKRNMFQAMPATFLKLPLKTCMANHSQKLQVLQLTANSLLAQNQSKKSDSKLQTKKTFRKTTSAD